jgi:hypothetical protein
MKKYRGREIIVKLIYKQIFSKFVIWFKTYYERKKDTKSKCLSEEIWEIQAWEWGKT